MSVIKMIVGIVSIIGAAILQVFSFMGIPLLLAEGGGIIGPILVLISAYLLLAAGILLIVYRSHSDEASPTVLYFITSIFLFLPKAEAQKIAIISFMVAIALLFEFLDSRRKSNGEQELN